ncbi:hypothetical protein GCM10010399_25200 [Dactylosporangium fulvum]
MTTGRPSPGPPLPSATTRTAPYLSATATAFCRGGGGWGVTITGTLHNAPAGFDPHGWVSHDGSSYGYYISGDGSTRFSGTVPPDWGGQHTLSTASTTWQLEVYINGDLITGDSLRTSGTARNPC